MRMGFNYARRTPAALAALMLALTALALSPAAQAQRGAVHHHAAVRAAAPHGPGSSIRFHAPDRGAWRGGRWVHDHHHGRLGWWWVAGGLWYLSPAPVYPAPWGPQPMLLAPAMDLPLAPVAPEWYYCEASQAYYPHTPTCPGGWKAVPATPAEASPAPTP